MIYKGAIYTANELATMPFFFNPVRFGQAVVDMQGKILEFPPNGNKAAPPKDFLAVMTVTAKVVVKAYTQDAAAQIARQRLDVGDAAFSDAHIVELTEVTT